MSFVFAQVFALQSALKFSFLLIVLTANFGDATKLFIIIYLFFLKECDRLFAKLFYTYFKVIICNTNKFEVFKYVLIFNQIPKNTQEFIGWA
jgi:hypothetical protein